jgi:hypothetical protein
MPEEAEAAVQEEPTPINRVFGPIPGHFQQVEQFLKKLSQEPGIPENVKNSALATLWMMGAERFRLVEEEFLIDGLYESRIADHRTELAALIATGEALIFSINTSGVAQNMLNFSVDDVRSVLESLHVTFRREHGPRNTEKTNQLIGQLFDAPKP